MKEDHAMTETEEFLMSKINELEKKVFDLDKRVKSLEHPTKAVPASVQTTEPALRAPRGKDTTRYILDGVEYKKNRLILATVSKYVKEHAGITAEELDRAFPSYEFKLVTFKCVAKLESIPENYKSPVKRYFIDDPIRLDDGTDVVVCTQWNATMTAMFVEYVNKNYGYNIVADR